MYFLKTKQNKRIKMNIIYIESYIDIDKQKI